MIAEKSILAQYQWQSAFSMAPFALTGSECRERVSPRAPVLHSLHPCLFLSTSAPPGEKVRQQEASQVQRQEQRGNPGIFPGQGLPCLTFPWTVLQCHLGRAWHSRCEGKEAQALSGPRHGGNRYMRYPCREGCLLCLRAPSWPWKTTLQWAALLLT